MTPENWHEVSELFNAVLDADERVREQMLDRAAPAVRRQVENLLASFESDPAFLERPAGRLPMDPAPSDSPALDRVGLWRLIERLGGGGMGDVYRAERDDGNFRKQGAVKLIRRGMDSEEILRRFRAERQILATLEHPNIARLMDGGIAKDGRSYLVMEFVEGRPLNVYCDENRLTIRDRLDLFTTICEAVHFAHRNLIVHRDLKPSNILVRSDGVPKLLDFGIAKLLDPHETDITAPLTRTEQRLMTPGYASPEQIRGEPVTTATDVYQLGVLLYELLSGIRPFGDSTGPTGRSRAELARDRSASDPKRPSSMLHPGDPSFINQSTPDLDAVCASRRTTKQELRRTLEGDLDTIILKAMHADPRRRYGSAEAMSDDISRYLTGQPVAARPDSLGYRARKFVRRHRTSVLAAAAFGLLLFAFAVTAIYQARRISVERDVARGERDKSEQVIQILVDLFEQSNPTVVPGGDTLRVADVLERGEAPMLESLSGQPDVQARMKHVLARINMARSDFDRAKYLLDDALAQQETLSGSMHQDALAVLRDRAHLARRLGEPTADSLLRLSLEMHRTFYGPRHERVATAIQSLAAATDDLDERRTLLEEALSTRRAVLPENSTEIAASLNALAALSFSRQHFEDAARGWRQALHILTEARGREHPYTLVVSQNLATVLGRTGRYEEAGRLMRDVVDVRRRILGPETVEVAASLSNLGVLLTGGGRFREAEISFQEALDIWETVLPENHWRTANEYRNLGLVLLQAHRPEDGMIWMDRSVSMNQRLYGMRSRQAGYVRAQRGILLIHLGRAGEALQEIRSGLDDVEAGMAPGHERLIAETRVWHGLALLANERPEEAKDQFRTALDQLETTLHESDPALAEARLGLAVSLSQVGDREEAEMLAGRSLAKYASWGRADAWLIDHAETALGWIATPGSSSPGPSSGRSSRDSSSTDPSTEP